MPACKCGMSPLGACGICTPPSSGAAPLAGTAVVYVDGERYPVRVTRTDGEGVYFEAWQPSGEAWVRVPLQPAPGGQALTEDERSYLAMHARYEAGRQDDFRYWDADPQKRLVLKRRWTEIADWLHPEPFGDGPPTKPARLTAVEEGYATAWNAGHVTSVKVIRDEVAEVPLVGCPECGQPATVDAYGHVKCLAVPGCFGGWRVTVSPVVQLDSGKPTVVDSA